MKKELLKNEIKHIDITNNDIRPMIDQMEYMAYQSRNLHNACKIYNKMLGDKDCAIILCLAGSLISAGLKKIIIDMLENNMVDVIVSTGANMVDQPVQEISYFVEFGFYQVVYKWREGIAREGLID